jgi:hypothetical protein
VCVRKRGNSVGVRFGDQKGREENSNVRFNDKRYSRGQGSVGERSWNPHRLGKGKSNTNSGHHFCIANYA